ncbi:NTF2 fold immunity protein [Kalamiella sp. sgz302252]|uniref:NTF2 fold immunity protein n=1 Tax=Pantoea sp. sgz302252 TaxID=3341827 RepID=UPI0036D35B8E
MSNEARVVLFEFIKAMNYWELTYYPLIKGGGMFSIKDEMRKELDKIFNNFCTGRERKQGRQVSLSCSEPPTYSPDEEVVNEEEFKNKVIIDTQQHLGFKEKYRYTLHFKNGRWLIDKKERFSDYENKWIKDIL